MSEWKRIARPVWSAGKGMIFDANNEVVVVVVEDYHIDEMIEAINCFEPLPAPPPKGSEP